MRRRSTGADRRYSDDLRAFALRLVVLGALVVASAAGWVGRASAVPANPVVAENARPGSPGWELRTAGAAIEGYATALTVAPGGTVGLHVATAPAARYRVLVYRLGWYGGAGARRYACLPTCGSSSKGSPRATAHAAADGALDAGWPVTNGIRIGRGWLSGYYLADLKLVSGPHAGAGWPVYFVVEAPPSRHAALLLQAPINTWEAYNNWGGKSLYAFNSTGGRAATRVSFERPFAEEAATSPLTWEIQLVRFLERSGYDVSYTTDAATDADPAELRRHSAVISAGHDEYWTKTIRDAFEAARDSGTNLLFLGADIADWQMRYADGGRSIVEYRDAALDPATDPSLKTTRFESLVPPRPQCTLLGTTFDGISTTPLNFNLNPEALSNPWFLNTGFRTNRKPLLGAVGYEFDALDSKHCPDFAPTVLFSLRTGAFEAEAVTYVAPSGARVFSSGSLQWNWLLDPFHRLSSVPVDRRVQAFMRNVVSSMIRHG